MRDAAVPSVTAVVLNFNYGRFIGECLASIDAQTHDDVHVLVIDDASTDDSLAVIERWAATTTRAHTIVAKPVNRGPAHSYNLAISEVSTDYVAVIDSDDRWLPDKVAAQIATFDSGGLEVVVVADAAITFGDDCGVVVSAHSGFRAGPAIEWVLSSWSPHPVHAILIRGDAFRSMRPLDETLRLCDLQMWLQLLRMGSVASGDRVVAEYRKHGSSISGAPRLLSDQLTIVGREARTRSERAAARRRGTRVLGKLVASSARPRARAAWSYFSRTGDARALAVWVSPAMARAVRRSAARVDRMRKAFNGGVTTLRSCRSPSSVATMRA